MRSPTLQSSARVSNREDLLYPGKGKGHGWITMGIHRIEFFARSWPLRTLKALTMAFLAVGTENWLIVSICNWFLLFPLLRYVAKGTPRSIDTANLKPTNVGAIERYRNVRNSTKFVYVRCAIHTSWIHKIMDTHAHTQKSNVWKQHRCSFRSNASPFKTCKIPC